MATPESAPGYDARLAAMIDHTILKPEATVPEIEKLCHEAAHYGFASVCINPSHVALCTSLLEDSRVAVCTVVGFPLGATTTGTKVFETEEAIRNGAREIDMVIAVGMLKSDNDAYVRADINAVACACHAAGAMLKVILETALLTDGEKRRACTLAKNAGADFVKTSTGFAKAGATAADVALLRSVVGPSMGVKAAGGIRTREDALAMISAGASRIGASASLTIIGAH